MKQIKSGLSGRFALKKIKSPKEQGRSMVEMLGVLAIIGVLSIGGIAGYMMAMNRYKANQILDMGSKLSVVSQSLYAANPDKWSPSDAYNSMGFDECGSSSDYESTFEVNIDGEVDVYVWKDGIHNALKSITGVEDSMPLSIITVE